MDGNGWGSCPLCAARTVTPVLFGLPRGLLNASRHIAWRPARKRLGKKIRETKRLAPRLYSFLKILLRDCRTHATRPRHTSSLACPRAAGRERLERVEGLNRS